MEFVKKPIPIKAIRWTGKNLADVKDWVQERVLEHQPDNALIREGKIALFIKRRGTGMTETLWKNIEQEGWGKDISAAVYDYLHVSYVGVKDGQWIMCGTEGEFYPCEDNGDGTAPLNYHDAALIDIPYIEAVAGPVEPDPLADMLAQEASSSMQDAAKALPSDIEVPETPLERGARHADKLINDVFVKVPQYEHADFNPATSHLHICAKTERSDNVCDKHCIHALYSLYDDLFRDTPAWVVPLVQWSREDIDILDFNKVEVPERLQGLLGHLPTISEGDTDGAQ